MLMLSDAISDFLTDQSVKGNSPYTLTYYESILKRFQQFVGDVDVNTLTVQKCKEYYFFLNDDGLCSGSVQTYIRGLRAFLRWLYENDLISCNLCHKFKLPKAYRKEIDILTDDEIYTLYHSFGNDFRGVRNLCVCSLMLDSGLRLNEVLTLQKSLFHLDERYCIVNGKCQKQRFVPIGKVSAEYIKTYLSLAPLPSKSSKYLFTREDGAPLTRNGFKSIFRNLKITSGISRLHPHLLRHTFATRFLENGGNIYALQNILGHTSLEMVKRYLHLSQCRLYNDFSQFSPLDNLSQKVS